MPPNFTRLLKTFILGKAARPGTGKPKHCKSLLLRLQCALDTRFNHVEDFQIRSRALEIVRREAVLPEQDLSTERVNDHFRHISENPLLTRKISLPTPSYSKTAGLAPTYKSIKRPIEWFEDQITTGTVKLGDASKVLLHYHSFISKKPSQRDEEAIKRLAVGHKIWSWCCATNVMVRHPDTYLLITFLFAEGGFPAISNYVHTILKNAIEEKGYADCVNLSGDKVAWIASLLKYCISFQVYRGDELSKIMQSLTLAKEKHSPFRFISKRQYRDTFHSSERHVIAQLLAKRFSPKESAHYERLHNEFLSVCEDSPDYNLFEATLLTEERRELKRRLDYITDVLAEPSQARKFDKWQKKHLFRIVFKTAEEIMFANNLKRVASLLHSLKACFPSYFQDEEEVGQLISELISVEKQKPISILDQMTATS